MQVGDYVRNQYGIAKIINIEKNNGIDILTFDKAICYIVDKKTGEIKKDRLFNKLPITKEIDPNKIKSSPEKIDLIQVGDYVNGCLVLDIAQAPKKALYLLEKDNHGALIPITNESIKDIVIKEQFNGMKYKENEYGIMD